MTTRDTNKAMKSLNEAFGRLPRSDKIYEDKAEKQAAYRARRKVKEEIKRTAQQMDVLLAAATAAAREGDRTARLFMESKEPDFLQRLICVFEERTRQREAYKARQMREQIQTAFVQPMTGKPMEPPAGQPEPNETDTKA